jgi:hypothetical protein
VRFADPRLQTALQDWRGRTDVAERAMADNFWFEERLDDTRRLRFEADAVAAVAATPLANLIRKDVRDNTEGLAVPETFAAAGGLAVYGALDEDQEIVRLESIQRALDADAITFEQLQGAFLKRSAPLLDKFLATWNTKRDARPAFAAFRSELADDLAEPDWPLHLRNRLGLAHYGAGGEPVALMRYTVREVLDAAHSDGAASAFAVPTVLDAPPNAQFFPSPAGLPCGRAMPLGADYDDTDLVAEILHARIAYHRRHLIGVARMGDAPVRGDLKALRNYHLLVLRIAADRDDYGEEID